MYISTYLYNKLVLLRDVGTFCRFEMKQFRNGNPTYSVLLKPTPKYEKYDPKAANSIAICQCTKRKRECEVYLLDE